MEPITTHFDLLPTLIELCEISPPSGVKFDGTSIKKLLYEADPAIIAPLKPGKPVPGGKAFRATPGKSFDPVKATIQIGDLSETASVAKDSKEVSFELELGAGKTTMAARFQTASGDEYGAYYA